MSSTLLSSTELRIVNSTKPTKRTYAIKIITLIPFKFEVTKKRSDHYENSNITKSFRNRSLGETELSFRVFLIRLVVLKILGSRKIEFEIWFQGNNCLDNKFFLYPFRFS